MGVVMEQGMSRIFLKKIWNRQNDALGSSSVKAQAGPDRNADQNISAPKIFRIKKNYL